MEGKDFDPIFTKDTAMFFQKKSLESKDCNEKKIIYIKKYKTCLEIHRNFKIP